MRFVQHLCQWFSPTERSVLRHTHESFDRSRIIGRLRNKSCGFQMIGHRHQRRLVEICRFEDLPVSEDLVGRSLCDDLSVLKDDNSVRPAVGEIDVVSRNDDGPSLRPTACPEPLRASERMPDPALRSVRQKQKSPGCIAMMSAIATRFFSPPDR